MTMLRVVFFGLLTAGLYIISWALPTPRMLIVTTATGIFFADMVEGIQDLHARWREEDRRAGRVPLWCRINRRAEARRQLKNYRRLEAITAAHIAIVHDLDGQDHPGCKAERIRANSARAARRIEALLERKSHANS